MLTKEEIVAYAQSLGYYLHSRSADWSSASFVKEFDNSAYCMHLTIDLRHGNMRLEAYPGMFTLTSGDFSYGHKNFKSLFEDRMSKMLQAIVYNNLY
jgi:hypothetical protein